MSQGTEHADIGINLNNLASLLEDKGDYEGFKIKLHRVRLMYVGKERGLC